jgi:hypothetical protein
MYASRAKFLFLSCCFFLTVSCRRDTRSRAPDTTSSTSQPIPAGSQLPVNTGWQETKAGPVILVSSVDNPAVTSVVIPHLTDSALAAERGLIADSLSGMSFDLFAGSGKSATGRIASRAPSTALEGCLAWPQMALELDSQHVWRVGFRRGMATSLTLDSLEDFSSADSAAATAELARLASAINVSNDPAFQGLPFIIRKAYRITSGRSSFLIGDIVRRIPQEATPREEHLLLIAEKSLSDGNRYQTVFETRASGSEDLVRTSEILAAVRFVNGGRVALIVSFEYENGGRIVLIERMAPFQWKLTWRSAYTGC